MQSWGTQNHIPGMYEDYVYAHPLVERRTSNITGAGYGIFAKQVIPAETVLFTYTAMPINYQLTLGQDRHYTFTVPRDPEDASKGDQTYCASFHDLGGFINDTVDFRPLTQAESLTLFHGTAPVTQYKHNCRYEHDVATKKVHIVAITDIAPDQELFVDYGINYWVPRYITGRKIVGVARATSGVRVPAPPAAKMQAKQ